MKYIIIVIKAGTQHLLVFLSLMCLLQTQEQ